MANKNKSSIIPEEYVLKNQEFDINEWRNQKIADALKYQQSRETGGDVPTWWEGTEKDPYFSENYGFWNNCLATATGAFGDKYCESGNKTFVNPKKRGYFQKKGFRELTDSDKDEYGDIWVDYQELNGEESPYHAVMLTGHDEKGTPLFTYGTGVENRIKKGVHYPSGYFKKKYRFVGTPDEIAEIEAHNAKVKEWKKQTAPLSENREVTRLNVEPLKKSLMEQSVENYLKKKKMFE